MLPSLAALTLRSDVKRFWNETKNIEMDEDDEVVGGFEDDEMDDGNFEYEPEEDLLDEDELQYSDNEMYIDRLSGYSSDEDEYNRDWRLIRGSLEGDIAMVELALNRGAKVNRRDSNGDTALIMASEKGHHDVVKLLLDRGAGVDEENVWGNTALMQASEKGHLNVVKLLLDRKAEIDQRDQPDSGYLISSPLPSAGSLLSLLFPLPWAIRPQTSHMRAACSANSV